MPATLSPEKIGSTRLLNGDQLADQVAEAEEDFAKVLLPEVSGRDRATPQVKTIRTQAAAKTTFSQESPTMICKRLWKPLGELLASLT